LFVSGLFTELFDSTPALQHCEKGSTGEQRPPPQQPRRRTATAEVFLLPPWHRAMAALQLHPPRRFSEFAHLERLQGFCLRRDTRCRGSCICLQPWHRRPDEDKACPCLPLHPPFLPPCSSPVRLLHLPKSLLPSPPPQSLAAAAAAAAAAVVVVVESADRVKHHFRECS